MARHRAPEDVIPTELSAIAPAAALRQEDIVLRHAFPSEELAAPQEPTLFDKARAGLQKLAPVGHAIVEAGRWFGRHKIGVTRTLGAVAACAAVVYTAKATGDLQFYATIHEAGRPFINLDTPAENLLAGGAASAVSVMSALAVMTMKNFRKEDAEQLAWEANNPLEAEQPVIDVEKLGYPRPGQRLTWMDEDDIFVTVPLLSERVNKPTDIPQASDVELLFNEIDEALREDSGQYQLVSAGR